MDILATKKPPPASVSSGLNTSQYGVKAGLTSVDTWMYFEVKQVYEDIFFRWNTVNVFARWFTSTHQTIVLVFDANSDLEQRILESLLHTDMSHLRDPFWVYPPLMEEVVSLFDSAIWAIRDRVRTIELGDKPAGRPRPDYRRLHDIARHAIHVTESLDVTVQNVGQIIQHHEGYLARTSNKDDLPSFPQYSIQSRLQFFQSWLGSLQHRSLSNEKRLQNEIQLAFNSVAQYDAGISVELGRAAQSDSAAMRTISFVTLTFLPPTFICAVFSMSFFNHTADGAWTVSTEFWIYWAIAIPTSIVTALLWHYWCYCSSLILRMTKKSQSTFDCEGQSNAMMGTSRNKPSHSSQPTARPTIEQDAYRGWSFFETVRSGSDKR